MTTVSKVGFWCRVIELRCDGTKHRHVVSKGAPQLVVALVLLLHRVIMRPRHRVCQIVQRDNIGESTSISLFQLCGYAAIGVMTYN